MKLVIERDKWLRGDPFDSCLLRPSDGKMCCLGFYLRACGVAKASIMDLGRPDCIETDLPKAAKWLLDDRGYDALSCRTLIRANDNGKHRDSTREKRIAAEFAKHGVEVEFV